ncbi:rhomboid family intramembrane serine protease [Paenibacillus beijingensis]|uniref:Rhomboid family protein n=1 Tax=Paenibacillus beijingensis TaxID=1126833 RepID=A0A0D5NEH1_9BACL|nr:rhomboid family intramembrane serine protease [Paenibacillus beijingensis]AJY73372.1 Rhomboid family protein [Paenibacillus beijingensis]
MIFLRYESFRGYLKAYPVTSVIIALNALAFVLLTIAGSSTDLRMLIRFGAFIQTFDDPYGLSEPWRYVTSIFLHSGFQHLFFNLFSLLVFAPPLERLLKPLRYAGFFLLCGVAGNLASALIVAGNMLSVGASGAIYGVYGAFLYIALLRKASLDESSRKTVYTILIFGVIYSFISPGINIWAHLGGGIAGFVLCGLFQRRTIR